MALSERKNWLARAWYSAFAPIREPQGFYRHRALVRLTHWINALCILILLGSGRLSPARRAGERPPAPSETPRSPQTTWKRGAGGLLCGETAA